MLLAVPAIHAMSYAFFRTTAFPDDQPPGAFAVIVRDTSVLAVENAITGLPWTDIGTVRRGGGSFSFLLPRSEGTVASHGHLFFYRVVEDRKTSQLIEVEFSNTHRSWSRYEAFDDRIVPVSYRTDGSFFSLIPVFGLLLAGFH